VLNLKFFFIVSSLSRVRAILWQILDFRAKQWLKHIIKCCHRARTNSLLYPKVRNNIGGDIPTDVPNQNIGGCVPGIPGRVDTNANKLVRTPFTSCSLGEIPFLTSSMTHIDLIGNRGNKQLVFKW